ncbi:unnamed protein product [Acanthoscelides obtectus]|uniref:Core Histone H2A/H2B/H3 domain-containing protein n=2 Tax=Acanthoscelides obtectus TaxID=200917 RepID=A0A9P0KKW7_ACAOB|nr:unnamed protein product [Acanthoscelides obtectus]CAK1624783.1 Histone H2B 3 [Acanthoscelides obtectus]
MARNQIIIKPTKKSSAKVTKTRKKYDTAASKRQLRSFAIDIYKVLKQVHPKGSISSQAIGVMNSFVDDLFERVAVEAAHLARYRKKTEITDEDIQLAIRLLLPPGLAKNVTFEASRAVTSYRKLE